MRQCPDCDAPKPLVEFYFRKSGRQAGRYYSYCKEHFRLRNMANWRTKIGWIDRYENMFLTQEGKCAICGIVFTSENKATTPHRDHNHITGSPRALLCHRCNTGISLFRENPDYLRLAANYVEHWSSTIQIGDL